MEISINTPALLFPAISLMMLAYTNRFLTLANLVRRLHEQYQKSSGDTILLKQIKNIRARLSLIRYMQTSGVVSFVLCVVCMYVIVINEQRWAYFIFAMSLFFLMLSLIFSLIEIWKSTKALDLELRDVESKENSVLEWFMDVGKDD